MASITSKGIEIEKSEILKGYGKPPPEGLIPVGNNGIYLSPNLAKNKPVSPFDCEQWPDSPYCGGVPWTRTPIGFDLDFGFDGCGAWIQGTPIIGFTKLPQVSAAWRKPGECRDQFQKNIPPSLPEEIDENSDAIQPNLPTDIPPNTRVIAVFVFDELEYYFLRKYDKSTETSTTKVSNSFSSLSVPGDFIVGYPGNQPPLSQSVATAYSHLKKSVAYYEKSPEGTVTRQVEGTNTSDFILNIHPRHKKYKDTTGKEWDLSINNLFRSPSTGDTATNESASTGSHIEIAIGRYGDLVQVYGNRSFANKSKREEASGFLINSVYVKNCRLVALWISEFANTPKAPPPDYKKRKCDCMQCCSSGQAQDRRRDQDNAELLALLRKIDKKLGDYPVSVNIFDANENSPGAQAKKEKLNSVSQAQQKTIHEIEKALKCIGIDQLPIYTPSSVIDDESNGLLGDLGDLKNNIFKQRIESLAEMMIWRAKNDNEIFGKWQESITIEDSDPTVKGNQPKKIVLPNMARTFRELVLLNSTQIKVMGMMFDTVMKMYIDIANTKISTAVSEAILRDIQDYLDYPTQVKKLDVPLGINIPSDSTPNDDKEDLERFLKNSTAKAAFDDWTGEGSMTEMLTLLMRMAEGYLGQNFGKL